MNHVFDFGVNADNPPEGYVGVTFTYSGWIRSEHVREIDETARRTDFCHSPSVIDSATAAWLCMKTLLLLILEKERGELSK